MADLILDPNKETLTSVNEVDTSRESLLDVISADNMPTPVRQSDEFTKYEAATSALLEDDPSLYEGILNEVNALGSSPTAEAIKQNGQEEETARARTKLEEISLDFSKPLEQKKLEATEVISDLEQTNPTDHFSRIMAERGQARDPAGKEQQEEIAQALTERSQKMTYAAQMRDRTFNGVKMPSEGDALVDTLMVFGLPGFAVNIKEVIDQSIPGFSTSFGDNILVGDLIHEYISHVDSLPFEEAKPVIDATLKAINDNEFFGRDNGFMKHDLFNTLLADLNPDNSDGWVTLLHDAVGILDVVGAGVLARFGFKGVKGAHRLAKMENKAKVFRHHLANIYNRKPKQSLASELDTVAREDSLEISKSGLVHPSTAEAAGTTPEQITSSSIYPLPEGVDIDLSPSLTEASRSILDKGAMDVSNSIIETHKGLKRIYENLKILRESTPQMHLNKSTIRHTEKGYEMDAIFGLSESRGFRTPADALQYVDALDTNKFFDPEVLVTNKNTGQVLPVKEVPVQHRSKEYWLKIKNREDVLASDAGKLNPILKDGVTGWWAKHFNKSAWLDPKWGLGGSAAADLMSAKVAELNRLLIPLNNLKTPQQNEVLNLIERGDQIGKWFKYEELLAEWGNRADYLDLVKGYQSFKVHQREARALLNEGVYNRAKSEGWKHLIFNKLPEDVNQRLGKPLKTLPEDVRKVYSPKEDRIIDITEKDIEIAAREGKQFVELNSPVNFNKVETKYALADDTTTLQDLPRQMIRDIPGYVTRLYEITHVIQQKVIFTNSRGVTEEKWVNIRGAKNGGDADRFVNQMNEVAEEGEEYRKVEARELRQDTSDAEYIDRLNLGYFEDHGQMFYSQRGELPLESIDGSDIIAPVSKRLEVARNAAARASTLDPLVDKMIKQWENVFGQQFGIQGRMPVYGDLRNTKGLTDPEKRLRADALAARDHIKMVAGIDDTIATKAINNSILWVADALATPKGIDHFSAARNWTSGKLALNRDKLNPINFLKQGAFLQMIVGNPLRQLILQSQQMSVYMADSLAREYFLYSAQGLSDYKSLVAGLAKRTTKDWNDMAPFLAKNAGMTVDEYTKFVDGIRQSGLLSNIDSHEFVSQLTLDSTLGGGKGLARVGEGISDGVKNIVKMTRKYGFDMGERMHLIAAYLVQRNKFIKENPGKDWFKNANEIGAQARQLSLNMNQAGALQFQKGLTGLLLQFMSHNVKAAQVLVPRKIFGERVGKLSDKSYTASQRMGLFVTQSAWYGLGGWGLYEGYDAVKAQIGAEPPPEVDLLIKEGIGGTLLSAAFMAADDDPDLRTALDISGSIGTFSGILKGTPISRVYDTQIFSNYQLTDIPGLKFSESLGKTLRTIGYLTGSGVNEILDLDPETNLPSDDSVSLQILDSIARLMPLYDKVTKAKAEIAIERFLTNSGNPTIRATASEILASSIFGFRPTRRREIEDTYRTITGGAGPREEGYVEHLNSHARTIYQTALRIASQQGDNIATADEVEKMVMKMSVLDKVIYDDFDYNYMYRVYMPKLIYDTPIDARDAKSRDGLEFELQKILASKVNQESLNTTDTILDKIKNFEDFEGKDQIVRWLENLRD